MPRASHSLWRYNMNIGLVLSGGFAKGAYQLGALRAISEFVPLEDIKCMSSSSIGTLNSYAYATGQMDKIEDMWTNIMDGSSRVFITKILRGSLLQQYIKDIFNGEPMSIPFYTCLLDYAGKEVHYKNLAKTSLEKVPTYLKASVAFPIYNKPVEMGARRYFDGGFVDNIPVHPLVKHDLDYIICIYFDDIGYQFETSQFDGKIIKITFPEMSAIKDSFLIKPEDIEEMKKEGYERTMNILSSIFVNGHEDLETIFESIRFHNEQLGSPKVRLTTDVVITGVNKTLARFAKRKVIF